MTTDPRAAADAGGDDSVDFGFRSVRRGEKRGLVRDLFAGVSGRYDLMNDLMSFRAHRLWKDAMVDRLAPRRRMSVLDLAGGTGDIAFRILARTRGNAEVTICDLTEEMLSRGRGRRAARTFPGQPRWICADGARLPFPDRTFDACTIAFGLRNVADPDAVLREAFRVLRAGGRFLCLEFSRVDNALAAGVYDAWSFGAIPRIGAAVTRDREAYQYLVESIRRFPPQEDLAEAMRAAGFDLVDWRNFSLGVVALHSGWRV